MINSYEEALNFIHGRTQFKKIPTLNRMRRFLAELGNPQIGLNYIHVTGTNGKGSTVAMMRSMLIASGLTVGSFTSPYITRFNERIALDGQPISDQDLTRLTAKIEPVVAKLDQELTSGGPTEFEIDTAIMFCYMAEQQPDVVLLEVGIGGLYDSTNVITPIVSVITTVSWDHMKYLGNTLAQIASQKAGIIKEEVPVVIGQLPAQALTVVTKQATENRAPLNELGRDFTATKINGHELRAKIRYQDSQIGRHDFELGLGGDYQVENAGVAIKTVTLYLQQVGIPVDIRALKHGLKKVTWPGRLETINDQPLVILDGAHNLPGMQALVKTIQDDFADCDVYVLVAILADKQYELMLGELASLGNVHITATHFAGPAKNRPSANLAGLTDRIKSRYPMQVIDQWQVAIAQIASTLSADDVLIITGSLYFISDVRQLFLN